VSFTVITSDQRSDEWRLARIGRLTGSRASDMLATIKSGEAAARRDYRAQLVVERLTGLPQDDGYINAVMQRGIDKEPEAFALYEAVTGHVVRRTGFLRHDSLMVGCSLDGDVDDFGGIVELKCPKSATHLGYWRTGTVPATHMPQLLHNLWVSGARWCDFVSYDDRFPGPLQLFLKRIERNDFDVMAYGRAAESFLQEVDDEEATVRGLMATALAV
jgi:predicted phage-related endonuclease